MTGEKHDKYIDLVEVKANEMTRENANLNTDAPAGMMMKFASETTKSFTMDRLLDKRVAKCVEKGYLHIHDLDYYPTRSLTCVQHPLDVILANGFFANHAESRPAK